MAKKLKPTALNTVGLDPIYSKIGTNIKNAQVYVDPVHVSTNWGVRFTAFIFWNGAAVSAWEADHNSMNPILTWTYEAPLDEDSEKSVRTQCLEYLLTRPEFAGFEIA